MGIGIKWYLTRRKNDEVRDVIMLFSNIDFFLLPSENRFVVVEFQKKVRSKIYKMRFSGSIECNMRTFFQFSKGNKKIEQFVKCIFSGGKIINGVDSNRRDIN